MNDVINGVPRELLERLEHVTRNLAPHLKCHADLTALLTAQPQASAAQSAPAGEREAFEAWAVKVGSAYVTASGYVVWKHENECGELAAFKAGAAWQRTQSAGVPDVCETCDGHGVVTRRSGQTPETYEEWNEDCPDCAAPAQGQQVECKECERLRSMLEDWEGDANLLEKERDEARAELSALKAQQVGQEPAGYILRGGRCWADEVVGTKQRADKRLAERNDGSVAIPLYTTPKPAPAQDVAGLEFVQKVIAKLRRFDECAEDFESGGVDIGREWLDLLTKLGLLARVQRSPAFWEMTEHGFTALAAHDKQSGEVKP